MNALSATPALVGSIPSPSSGTISLGPLDIHAYGLMIALGVVAAIWLAGRRLEAAGTGTRDDMASIGVWAVIGGVLGARLYYVITDASEPWREPAKWFKVWEGGLGIPGGLVAGILVALWRARRRKVSPSGLFTAAAPAVPLAQAIGRVGNWWNQELFGRPTDLPWGLEIDDAHLPEGYDSGTLFHPTFLYEMLWNLALCGVLLLIDKRVRLRKGRLLAIYVAGYAVGRFWVEGLRIDPANSGGGWRLNQWTALAALVGSVGYLLIDARRHGGFLAAPEEIATVDTDGVDTDGVDTGVSDNGVSDSDGYVADDD